MTSFLVPKSDTLPILKYLFQYHPDLHPNDPSCHERFIRLQEAYKILSNAQARREYDSTYNFRPNGPSRNPNSRPYGYPDFTQRDEWLKREEAR